MSIISKIKEWFNMLVKTKVKDEFNIEPVSSEQMQAWIAECINIYRGNPCWLDEEDNIDTVNFAKAVCSETARLATLGIGIKIDGSARADWLQGQIERIYYQLRSWVEYGCAYGTVILKPDGEAVRLYTPLEFEVTHHTDGNINGVVFHNYKRRGDKWYTLLEYHRFEDGRYVITNKCYVGELPDDTKRSVSIQNSPWEDLSEEVYVENVAGTLYGVLKMPQANNIDLDSPLGLPIFSEAIQELRDLDIAYSRNSKEIVDSKRIALADDSLLAFAGEPITKGADAAQAKARRLKFPDMVKMVRGDGRETYYQEINPELNTETRIKGINNLLSQIGYKSGFSNGHFVFSETNGFQTATGVEAAQQRTVQTTKDVRDRLESCIKGLIYALNVFADLYNLAPAGAYEVALDFGDVTYNRDEDRARWWGYVVAGKVPAWKFFVKFEGMTEDEAKEMVAEATPKQPKLFALEE